MRRASLRQPKSRYTIAMFGKRYSERKRALVMLNHAIARLSDNFVDEDESSAGYQDTLDAIMILMEVNRCVYSDVPVAPETVERVLSRNGQRIAQDIWLRRLRVESKVI